MPFFAGVCLCLYFSYHTVSGHRSYSLLSDLTSVYQAKEAELLSLQAESASVEYKVAGMRPGSISADMLEERVRLMLGYKRVDEIVVLVH